MIETAYLYLKLYNLLWWAGVLAVAAVLLGIIAGLAWVCFGRGRWRV